MKPFYIYPFGEHKIIQTPTLWSTYRGYNYLIAHKGQAYIFDPGETAPILNTLRENQLSINSIFLTHHHPDHVGATTELSKQFSCPVYGFEGDLHRLPKVSTPFKANETLGIASLNAKVLHLPGHTTGLCAFYVAEKNWLFSNDLLFSLGCGRVFEGTHQQMYQSLETISHLPPETLIFASHEYTKSNLEFCLNTFPDDSATRDAAKKIDQNLDSNTPTVPTSLEFELKFNPFLRWKAPYLREAIDAVNLENWEYFERLRTLKDQS